VSGSASLIFIFNRVSAYPTIFFKLTACRHVSCHHFGGNPNKCGFGEEATPSPAMQLANRRRLASAICKITFPMSFQKFVLISPQSLKTAAFQKIRRQKPANFFVAHVLQNSFTAREITPTTKPSTPINYL
jgi:hypothetical protein